MKLRCIYCLETLESDNEWHLIVTDDNCVFVSRRMYRLAEMYVGPYSMDRPEHITLLYSFYEEGSNGIWTIR